jgi:hypothetical protein
MPSDGHRHATDRTKTTVIGGCPNGCQSFEIESSGPDETAEQVIEKIRNAYDECTHCGAEIGLLRRDEPVEALD